MKRFKKAIVSFLHPPVGILLAVCIFAVAFLIFASLFVKNRGLINYTSYAVAAYAFTAFCCRIPKIKAFLKKYRYENRYVSRFFDDTRLRITLSLYSSLILNLFYGIFQLVLAVLYGSVWFYSISAYYTVLTVVRFHLLKYTKTNMLAENMILEYKRYRMCGIALLVMNFLLAIIDFYMVWQDRTFIHHEITTIGMAFFTFVIFTVSIVNVIKYRKHQSPVFLAIKKINLAVALVSILTLQNTMFTVFGSSEDDSYRQTMMAVTGFVVLLIILIMSIYMIIKSTLKINSLLKQKCVYLGS